MKTNLSAKFFIAICLCLIAALTFTACKDKEIYAESSDFESYPDYWNDFNDEPDDIYVPDNNSNTGDTSSDDWTANFDDDDDTSSEVDTDKDGITNKNDSDIDGDGVKNEDDSDIDGDGVDNDKDSDIDGDGTDNEGDTTPEGPSEDSSNGKHEGPFVPLN